MICVLVECLNVRVCALTDAHTHTHTHTHKHRLLFKWIDNRRNLIQALSYMCPFI